jgi:hypothetical protein
MRGTPNLQVYNDLNYIEAYATKFGLDPDHVWCNKAVEDVMVWIEKWHNERIYDERYSEVERMMSESKQ